MTSSPKITVNERRWAFGWAIAMTLLSCIPYIIAAVNAPDGWQFAGILVNPLDGHSYMAKMQQGVQGEWLFHLTYTPEPHDGAFIFTFYLALGHVARLTGLPNIVIFHAARVLAGLGLLLMAFRFITRVTPRLTERRLAFIFVFCAAGLGWLGVILGAFPIDLWIPEAFVPYSLYANPHFPLTMILMLVIFEQNLAVSGFFGKRQPQIPPQAEGRAASEAYPERSRKGAASPNLRWQGLPYFYALLWAMLAAGALAMLLPFALLTVWAVLVVFLSWSYGAARRLPWPQIWLTLGVIIVPMPVILYQYWVSVTNPVLAGWGAQNITAAPKWWDFWLGYGLVGLLAIAGALRISWRDRLQSNSAEWFVLIWAVTTIAIVYFPFDLQRRLITGLHLPLAILAAIGLHRWLKESRLKPARQRLATMAVIALSALGTLVVWGLPVIGTLQMPQDGHTTALFFIRQPENAALEWLQKNAAADDVILASPRVGMFVPGKTGARAFYGHPFETIQAKAKEAQAEAFYRGEIEAVSPPADFIFYGPSERWLGQPAALANYPVVFSDNGVEIYRVSP